ncbi:hypothetical protein [Mycobacterium branderi]|uniref:Proline rich protein n=1 Tax=Mycobacterium branderi TaxID=43348 RepID=A0A7I7VX54_9MYCO|nr:hypothetical protein [Mycobacterium branderi]MCV7232812.1 hypothetical protein [Mycobacterium branderi]ORA40942.1 hypothetical protein BST20_02000 [Mycobacterium branderi]BBZ09914.1 hypothetical protein MBRA_01090 [Mycobacterium branderi]
MKFFSLDRLKKIGQDAERGWPGYLFGGHVRTSTVVLVVAFVAVWWVYDTNKHATQSSTPTQVPATQVVPPGYVPDPNYTWVPRSRLQQPPTRTWTPTTTTTTTTTTTPPTTTTTTTTPPPPFQLPVLPPPFGPGTTTTSTPPPPPPGPAPAPPPP